MKLSFYLAGGALCCVEDRLPMSRRHVLPFAGPQVADLSTRVLGVLERANRARTLSEANLADLKGLGEELQRRLLPADLSARLRDTMGSLCLTLDAELSTLPWELLHDGEQFLCRRFDLGRLLVTDWPTRATVWRPTEPQLPVRMLVIGADPRGDLERLEAECTGLLSALERYPDRCRVRLLRAQDRESVLRALKDYDIVHFAGHADYDPLDPGGAGWHLGDGKLTAEAISGLGTARPMPALVFSNACQTGAVGPWGPDRQGRVLGLAGAFLLAGSRHYVGTQWELVDGIGAQVAAHFYDALARGANVGAALRAARLRVVETSGEASLGWASYVLYGDPTHVPMPATVPAAGHRGGATGRLGIRATLPWKRRAAEEPGPAPEPQPPAAAVPPVAPPGLPAWLVAALVVLLMLGAAGMGAWLFSLLGR